MGVGRSGYYAWRNRPVSKRRMENQEMTEKIRQVFEASKETYGSPRITEQLKANGVKVSRPRVARLMNKARFQFKSV